MGVELAPEPAVCVCVCVYVCVFVVFFFKCWCINYSLLLCYISLNWINSELFCFLIFTDNTCVCVCTAIILGTFCVKLLLFVNKVLCYPRMNRASVTKR